MGKDSHLEGPLFDYVQQAELFSDSKRFVDAVPLAPPAEIERRFATHRSEPTFDLELFIETHFEIPETEEIGLRGDSPQALRDHIISLWDTLHRAQTPANSYDSLIGLPHYHIVPGGRFREMYYWDSYFAAVGLATQGRYGMVRDMADNFAHLLDRFGYIPNGNREYYLDRSQFPVFALIVDLLANNDSEAPSQYWSQLETEYEFWLGETGDPRTVSIDGVEVNRYWSTATEPRRESFREDTEIPNGDPEIYRHIRAACESGWDFSSRWFTDPNEISTIRTTELVPIDLNTAMWHFEQTLAAWEETQERSGNFDYERRAARRRSLLAEYCWDDEAGWFFDIDRSTGETTDRWTLAGVTPLFFGLADQDQAYRLAENIKRKFLYQGGLVTTLERTGEQWDAPNGWAPLHWMAIEGLRLYGHYQLAEEITQRWTDTVRSVYSREGKLVEKYDVTDPSKKAGGGEYPLQDGFAWTNGVSIALLDEGTIDTLHSMVQKYPELSHGR